MIVQLASVYKNFGNIRVLDNINLSVEEKEIVCILGPSGCGKSTLLNIIARLIIPDSGEVSTKANRIGYVFQEDRLLPWKTVYENIKFVNQDASEDEILDLIKGIGLEGFADCYPSELSGGMKQRCSIARAFSYHPELLLMDEPFKSLDYSLRIKMIVQLSELWEHKENSICFVTHEIDEALLLGNRIIVLSNRPSVVVKEFVIKAKQRNRKLNSPDLVEIRSEIIDLLLLAGENA
ncbi:MAG: ABC transporter ATP-binding protein [Alkaliphilus sp.]